MKTPRPLMARWKPRLSIDAADTVWFPALGRVVDADEAALGHVLTALQLPGVPQTPAYHPAARGAAAELSTTGDTPAKSPPF